MSTRRQLEKWVKITILAVVFWIASLAHWLLRDDREPGAYIIILCVTLPFIGYLFQTGRKKLGIFKKIDDED